MIVPGSRVRVKSDQSTTEYTTIGIHSLDMGGDHTWRLKQEGSLGTKIERESNLVEL